MGFAILWVFLFHIGGLGIPYIDAFCSKGYLGVDIFFFLSGWGLCHSLSKNKSITQFYKRRVLKILPSWWTVIGLIAIVQIVMHLPHPQNCIDWILYFSGLGYFLQNCFVDSSVFVRYYEWYIPTLLLFYLLAPIFANLSIKKNVVILLVSVIAILGINHYYFSETFSLSYARVPIYIIGFIGYKLSKQKSPAFNVKVELAAFLVGLMLWGLQSFNVIQGKMEFLLVLLTFPFILSIIPALNPTNWFNKVLCFYGSISLELYLLHIYNRLFKVVDIYMDNRILAICISFACLTGLSYCVNKLSSIISKNLIYGKAYKLF